MVYDRYGSDGKSYCNEGVYTVTNNDGRWALQLMSTIFTPDPMIGMSHILIRFKPPCATE